MGIMIGFAGRKEAGKNVLCDICVENGFKLLYFALPLKQLTADLIGVRLEDIESLKKVESSYKFDCHDAEFISSETGVPFEHVKQVMCANEFKSVREILQVLGTDCIRKYDSGWHVKRVMGMVEELGDCNICISDVRFQNEADMVRYMGGDVWFVTRPYKYDNISNHMSETGFGWRDADGVIINDGHLSAFKGKWWRFLADYKHNMCMRKCLWEDWMTGVVESSTADLLYLNKSETTYKNVDKPEDGVASVNVNEEAGEVAITTNGGDKIILTNPLEMEDFKKYIV